MRGRSWGGRASRPALASPICRTAATTGPLARVSASVTSARLGLLTGNAMKRLRALATTLLALAFVIGASAAGAPAAEAASCVRVVGGTWNPPGNDNYPPALNAESVKIKNTCSTSQVLTGWRLHDNKVQHTFRFPSGFKIGPGVTVTIYSGRGTRTATKLYFGFTYGAVWNDTPPERAYLRNAAGTAVSSWSAY